jgi:hypothetical protein
MNRLTFFHSFAIAAAMLSFTGSPVFAGPRTLIEDGQPRADVKVTQLEDRIRVELDSKLFTEWRY